ncbi:serine/threonine-protein phosphatase [Streptomyces sp. RB6PN25]|uniref:Serine/threonine-protein phosphatase n=1 Tax=Streptomyces humicola TaxID=2953240 RepID=A0ABT1Q1K6_9ACTN|nr:PP2C family protein-serine/threonine phosphatase [Streptomyces humicola]MCQ4083170.1 serine/threonine-protein phosphatase [Streptomyces humicola]
MSASRVPKVAGIDPTLTGVAQNHARATDAPNAADPGANLPDQPEQPGRASASAASDGFADTVRPVDQLAAVQDRLATWISDLTTLHELTERLAATVTLDAAFEELLRAGASLVGARRGLAVLEPSDGLGPQTCVGYGLLRADLGTIETVPGGAASYGRLLGGQARDCGSGPVEVLHSDLAAEPGIDSRHREVATQLGFGASYGLRLATEDQGRLGAVVWFYDEPAVPAGRQRHLAGLYVRYAARHIARQLELTRARGTIAMLREELLPSRLPRVPGVRMAVRHRTGPRGGGDWYDALPLPEAALGLAVGGVTGSGPSAVAAMGRLRASLRAYAVMEGEDPVAVLSDLELLLRLTEPARSATALFAYVEPAARKLLLAGAGHCPPLIVGERRAEYVETSLSAPLGMLSCWEAPSVELEAEPGETLLLYTDGLLHRTGEPVDRSFAMLHAAAACAPRRVREDPELLVDHVLRTCLPDGRAEADDAEDIVLLATHFD